MLRFPSGRIYKIVYLDTNILNYIAKNKFEISKNFFSEYCLNDKCMFVITPYNLFELFKSKYESRENIIEFFDNFPLAVMYTYPQLIEYEKVYSSFHKDMIFLATGPKLFLNTQISNLFKVYDSGKFDEAIISMNKNFEKELLHWNSIKSNPKWMLNFNKNFISKMNELFQFAPNYFKVNEFSKFKSLEVYSFIANQFINNKSQNAKINSIIDAYNASVFPYVEVYITENTVGAWLEMAKDKFEYLKDIKVIKVKDLNKGGDKYE